ncbi:Flp family type IVb pilin [Methylobacterium sp. BTF04]|uniref:Flp family type IVb pilin n=1 Tax=Methylobacterium sp. BTF04 TaxID=2708300 RepID=UPI001FEFA9A0|nr:Flp family type IVb pilin [Methylobacterium sp. BTF04]
MTEPVSPVPPNPRRGDAAGRRRPFASGLWNAMARFRRDTRGATAIEYGLIVGLVFLAIVTALHLYADRVGAMYNYIGANIGKTS